jgi:S-adenosylmethionine decarboxylase
LARSGWQKIEALCAVASLRQTDRYPLADALQCTPMQGLHLTADLHGCRCAPAWLLDAAALGRACTDAVHAAGLQPVGQLFHEFPATAHGPGGVTATVLLAESHLCVHTWPEQRAVTLDVYVCNFGADHSGKARALMDALLALFDPTTVERHALQRGAVNEVAA